ncbi:SET domain-containing protein [Trametopsis cervina]|nr:SET domain-containing protein [Trametopsis cervina]
MSFADLRSTRKDKESKSFVSASGDNGPRSEAQQTADRVENDTDSDIHSGIDEKPTVLSIKPAGLPPSVNVRKTATRGRGVYATSAFLPGSVISSLRPRVMALSTSALSSYCSNCSGPPSPGAELKRCTRCRTVWYCDTDCQNKDWLSHKQECDALQRWAAAPPFADIPIPSDAIRCLTRIIWMRKKKGPDSEFMNEWNMLQSHKGSLPPAASGSYTHLAFSVVRYIGASSYADLAPYGLSSAGDLVDLISRFTTNSFTLTSPSLDPLGVCVSPTFALVNHSCEPNAVLVFPRASSNKVQEPQMQLVVIRPIAPEEEILTSYVDITSPRDIRRRALSETYKITCECSLCRKPTHLDLRQSMTCPKACGGTCPLPLKDSDLVRCNECSAVVRATDAVLDALRVGQEALDKASALQFKDPAKSLQLTTNILPILISAGLTPSSHPVLALTRLHQELLIATFTRDLIQDVLDRTVRAAASYATGVSSLLTYGHPVRATALAELGKLLAVDEIARADPPSGIHYPPSGPERLRLAYTTLLEAVKELQVGFGKPNEGGSIGKEVRETLVRLEKELGVWTQGIRDALRDQRLAGASK